MIAATSPEVGVSHRLAFPCELGAAREASLRLRAFLAGQGLGESELFQCELCLVEACNNAVQNTAGPARQLPITAEALCQPSVVELRVTDHTAGFALAARPERIDPRRENGRGLFIIQSMMEEVRYFRSPGENVLTMRRRRTRQQHRPEHAVAVATLEQARQQLAACQQTISGMARELCVRSESLVAIFRCCAELGRTSDLEGFGGRLLGDLMHLTGADWFVMRLVPVGGTRLEVFVTSLPCVALEPLALSGVAAAPLAAEVSAALRRNPVAYDGRRAMPGREPLAAFGPAANGVVQPLLFNDRVVGTLAVGHSHADTPFTALQAEMIRTFAEFMAVQVVNAHHLDEQVEARVVERELDIARGIQHALLPSVLPRFAGFQLAASWRSARQVGGDFYDAIPLGAHSVLLVVADVMGKGVPAAMFATVLRSLLRALAGGGLHPGQLLQRLNELLHAELSSVGMFITAQLVFVDYKRRHFITASAGHCPVLVLSQAGVCPVQLAGTPLGILPRVTYRTHQGTLLPGTGLLLFTDGVTEALNPAGEMFGQPRLMAWLADRVRRPLTADAVRDELAGELARFRGGAALRDDEAFLILAETAAVPPAAGSAVTTGAAPAAGPARLFS